MSDERRKLRFNDWDEVLHDLDGIKGEYHNARRGNWSLGQICNHLATIMECALDGFPSSLPWPMQRVLKVFFLPAHLRHDQLNLRFPTPPFARPPQATSDEEGVARLRAAIERFRQPDAEYVSHVAFGELTRDQWKHQQLWHCEHHLSFLLPGSHE
jgi:hypothetical protein